MPVRADDGTEQEERLELVQGNSMVTEGETRPDVTLEPIKKEDRNGPVETTTNGTQPADGDPPTSRPMRDASGRYLPGHPHDGGGRPAGSRDGLANLRRSLGDWVDKALVSGELERWFQAKMAEPKGKEWLLKFLRPILITMESQGVPTTLLQVNVGIGEPRSGPPPGSEPFPQVEGVAVQPALPGPNHANPVEHHADPEPPDAD